MVHTLLKLPKMKTRLVVRKGAPVLRARAEQGKQQAGASEAGAFSSRAQEPWSPRALGGLENKQKPPGAVGRLWLEVDRFKSDRRRDCACLREMAPVFQGGRSADLEPVKKYETSVDGGRIG